jgi:hypothetical protein
VLWSSSLLLTMPAVAADSLTTHLFVSQALTCTDHNNYLGDTERRASLDFSEIGVGAALMVTPRWRLAGQLLSRRAGENDDGNLRLDYGFVGFTPISDMTQSLQLRAGRIPFAHGLYNESRDVAFTRSGIFMPQGLYLDRIRNSRFAIDGADLDWMNSWGLHTVRWRTQLGVLRVDDDEAADYGAGGLVHTLDAKFSWTFRAEYDWDEGRLRSAVGHSVGNFNYRGDLLILEYSGELMARQQYLSLEYNLEKWILAAELETSKFDAGDIGGRGVLTLITRGMGYYAQATYRIDPHWSVLLRHNEYYIDRKDRDGDIFTLLGIPRAVASARDVTLGLSWQPDRHWLLRAEATQVHGLAWITARDNPDLYVPFNNTEVDKSWLLLAAQVAFRY